MTWETAEYATAQTPRMNTLQKRNVMKSEVARFEISMVIEFLCPEFGDV